MVFPLERRTRIHGTIFRRNPCLRESNLFKSEFTSTKKYNEELKNHRVEEHDMSK